MFDLSLAICFYLLMKLQSRFWVHSLIPAAPKCKYNAFLEMQIVHVESGILATVPGLREHCVQGNVMLMSIFLLLHSFVQNII